MLHIRIAINVTRITPRPNIRRGDQRDGSDYAQDLSDTEPRVGRCGVCASGTLFMFAPTSSPEEPDAVWDVLCPLRALTTTNRRDSFGSPPLKFKSVNFNDLSPSVSLSNYFSLSLSVQVTLSLSFSPSVSLSLSFSLFLGFKSLHI